MFKCRLYIITKLFPPVLYFFDIENYKNSPNTLLRNINRYKIDLFSFLRNSNFFQTNSEFGWMH